MNSWLPNSGKWDLGIKSKAVCKVCVCECVLGGGWSYNRKHPCSPVTDVTLQTSGVAGIEPTNTEYIRYCELFLGRSLELCGEGAK